jgi:cell wall-associated NlpC family hydrolase
MMKYTLVLFYLFFMSAVYANVENIDLDCSMQIKKVDHTPETFTMVITHDKSCEILVDHNASHINLVSKVHVSRSSQLQEDTSKATPPKVDELIMLAKSKLGNRYEPAKAGPDHFDCSGFVYFLYKSNGINIPRTSLAQSKSGKKLSRQELERGDILFFDTHHRNHVNHSGIYLGEGKFIHSSSGKAYGVTISELDKGFYLDKFRWGVRKIEE